MIEFLLRHSYGLWQFKTGKPDAVLPQGQFVSGKAYATAAATYGFDRVMRVQLPGRAEVKQNCVGHMAASQPSLSATQPPVPGPRLVM
jgi:hypothetical protein